MINTDQEKIRKDMELQKNRALLTNNKPPVTLSAKKMQLHEMFTGILNDYRRMHQQYVMVGGLAKYFSLDFIAQEGKTDINLLDKNYMLAVGTQALNDLRALVVEKTNIDYVISEMGKSVSYLLACENHQEYEYHSVKLGASMMEWAENIGAFTQRFNTICVASLMDMTNHLNTARSPENQLIIDFNVAGDVNNAT